MIQIIWEYQVDAAHALEFERVYGREGDWVRLFRQAQGYQDTFLLKDLNISNRYLTIDRWNTFAAFEHFKTRFAEIYEELDKTCEKMTLSEKKIGIFTD